jgi:hypothetical protein
VSVTPEAIRVLESAQPKKRLLHASTALLPWQRLEVQVRHLAARSLGRVEVAVRDLVVCGVCAPNDIAQLLAVPLSVVHDAFRALVDSGLFAPGSLSGIGASNRETSDEQGLVRVERVWVWFDLLLWSPVPSWVAEAGEWVAESGAAAKVPARRSRRIVASDMRGDRVLRSSDQVHSQKGRTEVLAVREGEQVDQFCTVGLFSGPGRRRIDVSFVVAGVHSPRHDTAARALGWEQLSGFVDQVRALSDSGQGRPGTPT